MSKYGQFYRKPSLILFRTERVCPSVTNSQIHSLTLNVFFFVCFFFLMSFKIMVMELNLYNKKYFYVSYVHI